MAHPYAKYAANKVGKARAKVYQSGGAVDKLPTHPHARGQWERLSMSQADAQRDHDRVRGLHVLKAIATEHPYAKSGSGWWAREQGKSALRHSDMVPRRKED